MRSCPFGQVGLNFTAAAIDESRHHAQGVRTVDLDLVGDLAWCTAPIAASSTPQMRIERLLMSVELFAA